ncbi:MAG: hypothetical protein M1820_007932 [Bogoriella megaspora]|nr:MAG: hypothetical protein M1820_007932 [Bogoriella megaspora]
MDPLSVSASIIAVLQAAGAVLAICYDFRAIVTKSPWTLTRLIEETRALRDVLEMLESTASANPEGSSDNGSSTQKCLEFLCEPQKGILASCLEELKALETKLDPFAKQPAASKGRRKALFQALGWQLKSGDAKTSLKRIERYKNALCLALTVDQKSILIDIKRATSGIEVSVESTDIRVSKIVEQMRFDKTDNERREIFQWLSPLDIGDVHETAVKTSCKGTGLWLVESTEFSEWLSVLRGPDGPD